MIMLIFRRNVTEQDKMLIRQLKDKYAMDPGANICHPNKTRGFSGGSRIWELRNFRISGFENSNLVLAINLTDSFQTPKYNWAILSNNY